MNKYMIRCKSDKNENEKVNIYIPSSIIEYMTIKNDEFYDFPEYIINQCIIFCEYMKKYGPPVIIKPIYHKNDLFNSQKHLYYCNFFFMDSYDLMSILTCASPININIDILVQYISCIVASNIMNKSREEMRTYFGVENDVPEELEKEADNLIEGLTGKKIVKHTKKPFPINMKNVIYIDSQLIKEKTKLIHKQQQQQQQELKKGEERDRSMKRLLVMPSSVIKYK